MFIKIKTGARCGVGHLIPVLGTQRQTDPYEFEDSLVYKARLLSETLIQNKYIKGIYGSQPVLGIWGCKAGKS